MNTNKRDIAGACDVNSFKNKTQVNTNIANRSITIPSTDAEPEVLSQSAASRQLATER